LDITEAGRNADRRAEEPDSEARAIMESVHELVESMREQAKAAEDQARLDAALEKAAAATALPRSAPPPVSIAIAKHLIVG
jgi:antitoxin component HigA of HigAB toxin-antitoxin module